MTDQAVARKGQGPRILTASEIRSRVEELADELAKKLRINEIEPVMETVEAVPLDSRRFIGLMSDYMRFN
jgi:hypothetical protein